MLSIEKGYHDIVSLLLLSRIDAYLKDKVKRLFFVVFVFINSQNGKCALVYAIEHDSVEMIKMLLNRNVDVNKPVSCLTANWKVTLDGYLAAIIQTVNIDGSFDLLLDNGEIRSRVPRENIKASTMSPLMVAALWGKVDAVALLLSVEADANYKDNVSC